MIIGEVPATGKHPNLSYPTTKLKDDKMQTKYAPSKRDMRMTAEH
jgi:hypothetical protein